jgi:hypothetical protein
LAVAVEEGVCSSSWVSESFESLQEEEYLDVVSAAVDVPFVALHNKKGAEFDKKNGA